MPETVFESAKVVEIVQQLKGEYRTRVTFRFTSTTLSVDRELPHVVCDKQWDAPSPNLFERGDVFVHKGGGLLIGPVDHNRPQLRIQLPFDEPDIIQSMVNAAPDLTSKILEITAPIMCRKYSEEPAGPLELLVMALGRELHNRERPGDDWFDLVGSSVAGYCRRACEARGIHWDWVRLAIVRESGAEDTERR